MQRVNRPRIAAQASYDWMSGWYDWLTASERQLGEQALRLLAPRPGERVLEIGCGPGRALVGLARAVGPTGHVTGFDLSGGMLGAARERVERAGLPQSVTLLQGDAVRLPLRPAQFEAVFMGFTLELFDTPDIPRVLGQVRNVLVENGRFCTVSLSRHCVNLSVRLYELAHTRWPTLIDCRPINVEPLLQQSGFAVQRLQYDAMFGLPVVTAIARPNKAKSD